MRSFCEGETEMDIVLNQMDLLRGEVFKAQDWQGRVDRRLEGLAEMIRGSQRASVITVAGKKL